MHNLVTKFKSAPDKTVILITSTAIAVSSALAIFTAVKEMSAMGNPIEGLIKTKPALSETGQVRREIIPKPSINPNDLLPPNMKDFDTNAHHEIPGSEGRAAEAIYQPQGDQFTDITPVNSYVSISYRGSDQEAVLDINRTLEARFPKERAAVVVDNRSANSGYSSDYGSYFVGWNFKGFSVKIITTYINAIPANPKDNLKKVGDIMSSRINLYISNPKYRKGDQAQ